MQLETARPTIPFSIIDLSSDNPIAEILNAPKFSETEAVIYKAAATQRALISSAAAALVYTLVRNAKPLHIVEIGTYHGGTSEVICQALHENGSGILHTVGPFETECVIPIFESWPPELRRHLEFYPMTSMDFYYRLYARGIRPEIGFIDGDHSYQVALFDIQSLAKLLARRGFLLVDDISEPGPYYAAMDFLQGNPDWTRCKAHDPQWADSNKAFDRERSSIPETNFEVLRAPRGYSIGSRPVTFGEVPSGTEIKGLRIHAESACGTLHVQCVLRGFGTDMAEEVIMATIEIATPGKINLVLSQPIEIKGSFERCSAEPWLVWQGETPLVLAEIPTIISPRPPILTSKAPRPQLSHAEPCEDLVGFCAARSGESDMKNHLHWPLVVGILTLGLASAMAQAPMQAPRTYECAANAHCSVSCQIDGEKQMQTGAPKTVTITLIAPNNYVVELVEQNGHVQFLHFAGTKVVCNLDGLTKKGAD
jgi:Methyltransferase domain